VTQRAASVLAGVDEAGRGPLAGPVVAAAVILGSGFQYEDLADSKKLSERKREEANLEVRKQARAWSIGLASAAEIDHFNIHTATLIAMRRAVLGLPFEPERVIVDGNFTPNLPWPSTATPRADATETSVSAASVLAKVFRDRYMRELDEQFPEYGFGQHKGYPTRVHLEALEHFGPSLVHRFSFRPVREALRTPGRT
jgi:ribonuclease HII